MAPDGGEMVCLPAPRQRNLSGRRAEQEDGNLAFSRCWKQWLVLREEGGFEVVERTMALRCALEQPRQGPDGMSSLAIGLAKLICILGPTKWRLPMKAQI